MKTTIVIDTNVLISGYLWNGKPRQAIKIVGEPPYELLYCHEYSGHNHSDRHYLLWTLWFYCIG